MENRASYLTYIRCDSAHHERRETISRYILFYALLSTLKQLENCCTGGLHCLLYSKDLSADRFQTSNPRRQFHGDSAPSGIEITAGIYTDSLLGRFEVPLNRCRKSVRACINCPCSYKATNANKNDKIEFRFV